MLNPLADEVIRRFPPRPLHGWCQLGHRHVSYLLPQNLSGMCWVVHTHDFLSLLVVILIVHQDSLIAAADHALFTAGLLRRLGRREAGED